MKPSFDRSAGRHGPPRRSRRQAAPRSSRRRRALADGAPAFGIGAAPRPCLRRDEIAFGATKPALSSSAAAMPFRGRREKRPGGRISAGCKNRFSRQTRNAFVQRRGTRRQLRLPAPGNCRTPASPGRRPERRRKNGAPRLTPRQLHAEYGSWTTMVSSRSGLVDSSATGVSINSSILRMYLIAFAGRSAQLRALRVLACQPSRLS